MQKDRVISLYIRNFICCMNISTSWFSVILTIICIILTLFSMIGFTYGPMFYTFNIYLWIIIVLLTLIPLFIIVMIIISMIGVSCYYIQEILVKLGDNTSIFELISVYIWNTNIIVLLTAIYAFISQIIGSLIMSLALKQFICNYISFVVGIIVFTLGIILIAILFCILFFAFYLFISSMVYNRKYLLYNNISNLLCCINVNVAWIGFLPTPLYILLILFSIIGFTYGPSFYFVKIPDVPDEYHIYIWIALGILFTFIWCAILCSPVYLYGKYLETSIAKTDSNNLQYKKIDENTNNDKSHIELLSFSVSIYNIITTIILIFATSSQIIGTIILYILTKHLVCNYLTFNLGAIAIVVALILIVIFFIVIILIFILLCIVILLLLSPIICLACAFKNIPKYSPIINV